jgi:hypothetical protein
MNLTVVETPPMHVASLPPIWCSEGPWVGAELWDVDVAGPCLWLTRAVGVLSLAPFQLRDPRVAISDMGEPRPELKHRGAFIELQVQAG